MAILHICKYYDDSTVHADLIKSFSVHHKRIVKVLIGTHGSSDSQKIDSNIYRYVYSKWLRFFLLTRSFCVFWFAKKSSVFTDVKLVFCHTLVVDGILGYMSKIRYGIPYVIQVRNTDINFYYKRFPLYRPLFDLIIKNASEVGFVSVSNRDSFLCNKGVREIINNAHIWPNGINDFWLTENEIEASTLNCEGRRNGLLFVGRFNENKNLGGVVDAHQAILKKGFNVSITYVGGSLEDFELCTGHSISKLRNTKIIERLDMRGLSKMYSSSICLIVPSFVETFGLVYLEALSRKCPVICSQGQGIYSLFPECKSIQFVHPSSIESISHAMCMLINSNLNDGDFPCLKEYSWNSVSKNIYLTVKGIICD